MREVRSVASTTHNGRVAERSAAQRSAAMGKLQEFDVAFTNNKVVYGPGESISGTVKIRTGNSLQYKGKIVTNVVFIREEGTCFFSTATFTEAHNSMATFPPRRWTGRRLNVNTTGRFSAVVTVIHG